jgi:hypothetical protein
MMGWALEILASSSRIQNLSRHLFCNRFSVRIYISGVWEMESQLISENKCCSFLLTTTRTHQRRRQWRPSQEASGKFVGHSIHVWPTLLQPLLLLTSSNQIKRRKIFLLVTFLTHRQYPPSRGEPQVHPRHPRKSGSHPFIGITRIPVVHN